MEVTKIKIALYKEKPIAQLRCVKKDGIMYMASIKALDLIISFKVPFSDIGDAVFGPQLESQLLIRWLMIPENNQD